MNFRNLTLPIVFLFLTMTALGQESNLRFSGYLENTLTFQRNKVADKTFVTDENRVRLNISNTYGDVGDFSIAIVGSGFTGQTSINFLDYLPEEEAAKFSTPVTKEKKDDIWFQEAYGSLYLGDFSFRIGRQKYYTGTGYAWNPTDLFNWKDVFDPTYEIEGIDSVYLSQTFFEQSSLTVFYSFGTSQNAQTREYEALEDGDYQVKMKSNFFNWEFALVYSNLIKDYYDYEGVLSGTVVLADLVGRARWDISGIEFSGELFGVGIHAEGGSVELSNYNSDDELPEMLKDHQKYLVGLDYTFNNGLFLILEYYYEGLGENSSDDYQLNQRMAYLLGNMDSIGEDNIYTGISYPVSDLTTLALYAIVNVSDSSAYINPWLTWIAANDITVNFAAQFPFGDDQSVVGRSEPAVFGRVNFSF